MRFEPILTTRSGLSVVCSVSWRTQDASNKFVFVHGPIGKHLLGAWFKGSWPAALFKPLVSDPDLLGKFALYRMHLRSVRLIEVKRSFERPFPGLWWSWRPSTPHNCWAATIGFCFRFSVSFSRTSLRMVWIKIAPGPIETISSRHQLVH